MGAAPIGARQLGSGEAAELANVVDVDFVQFVHADHAAASELAQEPRDGLDRKAKIIADLPPG